MGSLIRRTWDQQEVNEILRDDSVWPYIAPKNVDFFDAPIRSDCEYYMVDGGVIVFHEFLDGVKMHPNFLPDARGKHAFSLIRKSVEMMLTRYQRIYVEIDNDLKHVRLAANACGFRLVRRWPRRLYVRTGYVVH